ncbi:MULTISPECIES: peroxiredoxin [Spiribacter]|uniref:peroxiredoxin n=1 Tax=Spiribacter TaxID=1335745 RepID=UPI0013306D89|nr:MULTISPECIES: peroxiredoxin [Spiribacter]KAF0283504.1 peroxiredoxin [Spiribacter roseus]KAF0285987.1 peroxiredoxin [Spiribacter sp. SSL99]
MTEILLNQPVADFERPTDRGDTWRLADQRGGWVVLYFFPKASTPGCTVESEAFRDLDPRFNALNAQVAGISRDGPRALANFRAKYDFPFVLLSDKDETVCNQFGVMRDKMMFGKPARGIERSTFLIDPEGVLREEWRKVSVEGHAEAVLEALRAHSGG